MSLADTNVLVRATLVHAPEHARARSALDSLAAEGPVSISRQIMREYVAVVTRQQIWGAPVPTDEAVRNVELAARGFVVLEDGPAIWTELRALGDSFTFGGKQVHDANIVATMLAHGVRRILTFNARDFRRLEPLIEVVTP